MKRSAWLALAGAVAAWGQFQDLATTDDGGLLYFSSPLRQRGSHENLYPKLFVMDATGAYLYAERDPGPLIGRTSQNFFQLTAPEVSRDGAVVAFTAARPCSGGSGCINVERYQANVLGAAKGGTDFALGRVTISRNGLYAATYGATAMFLNPGTDRWDLTTGEKIRLPYNITGIAHRRIALDGTVLLANGSKLVLWRKSGVQTLENSTAPQQPMLSDDAARVIYETSDAAGSPRKLIAYEVAAHRETVLATADVPTFGATISGDGLAVSFVMPAPVGSERTGATLTSVTQAFVVRADGTGLAQLTTDPAGITEAAISGNGQVVYAITSAGRLLAISQGTTTVRIPRTPNITGVIYGAAPGSMVRLIGTGLSDASAAALAPLPDSLAGVQVKFGGVPAPLQLVTPTEIWWQVRWYYFDGPTYFELVSGNSPFVGGPDQITVARFQPAFYTSSYTSGILALAAHSDWSGLVTRDNPAREGEFIHLYMNGLGAVVPPVGDGAAAPLDPLSPTATPLRCVTWDGQANPTEVLFAGLAPEMVGIYQVDLRVPTGLHTNTPTLECDIGSGDQQRSAQASLAVQATGTPLQP